MKQNNINEERIVLIQEIIQFVLFLCLLTCSVFLSIKLKETKEEDDHQVEVIESVQEEKKEESIDTLQKKYDDMVGWVEIKGTDFSYPVMKTGIKNHHEDDWMFYLHADVNGEYSYFGTPFMDVRCNDNSDNLIIYGHNINGRKLFGYLQYFRDEEFYKKNHTFTYTKVNDVKQEYNIVAVIETDKYSSIYDFTEVGNEDEYAANVLQILNESKFSNDMNDKLKKELNKKTVEAFFHKYQFVSLSTCRTGEGQEKRLLVIGCREKK